MQTLRKRTSPCKYKNDPSRFLGEGITFKAKLIGILEVSEARGDKMCQDALNDLKTAIRAAGEHKQRITISISIDGLKLRDEKTGDCLYHHPVHKISFIAQDMSDSRAFGYIFGSPDTGHRFFGIKTDKTASQVVISMRDLFQVVFELKKKEIEMAKHHTEHHHTKYGSTGYLDSLNFSKSNNESEKGKAKYSQIMKSKCMPTKANESFPGTDLRGAAAEAIADLLDLEHELNNIQQGISQMEKITPSDPFGPLSKGDSYDPFDDSFSSKIDHSLEEKNSLLGKPHLQTDDSKEIEKNFLSSVASEKTDFFPQFSPTKNKSKVDDDKWFEHESEAFFDESTHISDVEFTTSPASVLNNSGSTLDQGEGRRSPLKIDLFTELDPLGTGRVKPYVDKKDFFQELKNPPKKLLKEMIVDTTSTELSVLYFPAHQHREKISSVKSNGYTRALDSMQPIKDSSFRRNFTNIDPFEDGDPFEKTDPFQEENFLTSEAFAPLFGTKTSTSDNFDEKTSWRFDEGKESIEDTFDKNFSATPPLFSSDMLKVSLPPENLQLKPFITSSKICKQKSPSNSPEDSKIISRKIGQILKHGNSEKNEDIATLEKPSINNKGKIFESKFEADNFSSNNKFFTSPGTIDKIRSDNEKMDPTTPDPPPRTKTALFSIKPPPLPPKKQIQLVAKPPARPPLEHNLGHYDYLKQKEVLKNENEIKDELKCVKLKQQLFNSKELISKEPKKRTTESGFPVLPPPPPQKKIFSDLSRKTLIAKDEREKENTTVESEGSILNIKLRQLDKVGIENLAMTLGIPSENIYCMTLQDLTKMLAEKYLPLSTNKMENSLNENFEVDFESNFANTYVKEEKVAYDKYAVFKELIKNENELKKNDFQIMKKRNLSSLKENGDTKEEVSQEEDKYAALRLLSLNSQSNQFSADDDDDDYNTAAKTDKICDSSSSIEKLPFHAKELNSEKVIDNINNKMEHPEEKIVKSEENEDLARTKSPEIDTNPNTSFTSENLLFPNEDEHFNENNISSERNNWATFEKLNFEETINKKSSDLFEENENSPFSSDGKEELREIPFCWHKNDFSKKTRKDVPWRDEEESWEDDYSPKESFCSDESSHEEHSPKSRRDEIFTKQRSKRGACTKTNRKKNLHWSHRGKWREESEDEFEGSWTKNMGKTSSYDLENKKTWRGNTREERNKHCDWNNSRDGSRGDDKRHSHYYGNRCKRSESDNEYRKRCDSDTSEKEYAWTFRKNSAEMHGRSEKTKHYHSSDFSFRDCPEYCHKSRSKHRKGTFQKRPNSASESKRNNERFFSPGHSFREDDKIYPVKKESNVNEFFKCDHDFRESRYIDDANFKHVCSRDRKELTHHSKSCCRNSRRPSELYSSLGKRLDTSNIQIENYQYYGLGTESKYDKANDEHFNFDAEGENFGNSSKIDRELCQSIVKSSDRRQKLLNSKNEKISGNGFFSIANNDENNANSKDFKTKNDEKAEGIISDPKTKNQLADPELQTSTVTLRKSDSINIFSRDKDPFEGDDFFNSVS